MLAMATSVMAQVPDLISYQAVVRNTSNQLIINQNVTIKISILEGGPNTIVYQESHSTNTNGNGLATIQIGGGTVITGTFADINWADYSHNLSLEIDPTGGTTYTITGNSQLISVPYALHAKTVEKIPSSVYHQLGGLDNVSYDLTATWEPIGPWLVVIKENDATVLEITYHGPADGGDFTFANGVQFELRVDGVAGTYGGAAAIRTTGTTEQISCMSVFEGLSAGGYTVQMYAKTGTGTSTGVTIGGWSAKIICKESY